MPKRVLADYFSLTVVVGCVLAYLSDTKRPVLALLELPVEPLPRASPRVVAGWEVAYFSDTNFPVFALR